MTPVQVIQCPQQMIRFIYDLHAEHERNHNRLSAYAFTEQLNLKMRNHLMFGVTADDVTFDDADLLRHQVVFHVQLSLNGTKLPVIKHTLYEPKWLEI